MLLIPEQTWYEELANHIRSCFDGSEATNIFGQQRLIQFVEGATQV